MTTSATKIVSATDNTNRNNNYNNNNNNTNHNHNMRERRNSDASNNSYKISNNNNNNNNNNNKINDKNTSSTGTTNLTTTTTNNNNEYVALKTQTPVAMVEQQQQHQSITDMSIKHEATSIIPITTTASAIGATTMSIPTTTPNIVQNGIINLTTSSSSLSSSASTTRAMQSDEDFNIRFVNLVRLHKCLYDKKVPEYRNRDNQEKAWSLISQETRESVIHCKERWRNLRACLSRYIKQQSGSDPQHKPYYLTEHMAFLLPFLKSTRGGNTMHYSLELHQQLTNNNSSQQSNNLSALFPISATGGVNPMHLSAMTVIPIHNTVAAGGVQIKHSLSENDDEETIDAFDPAITGTLQQQQEEAINLHQYPQHYQQHAHQQQLRQRMSPALSDTASANSLQHYIPDVQLSEAPSSEYNQNHHHQHQQNHNALNDSNHHHHQQNAHNAKRIKLECDGGNNSVNGRICVCGLDSTVANNPDMEFFRSILPDIAFLSAQQKRKLKIGILELIDDVAARYPGQATTVTTTSSNLNMVTSTPVTNHLNGRQRNLIDRSK